MHILMVANSSWPRKREERVAGVLRFPNAFPTAAAGQTATEFEPDGRAADEIRELWGFVSAELRKTQLASAPVYA